MTPADPASPTGPETRQKLPLVVTDRDIVFNCPHCRGELVVDRDGTGMEVPCSHCGRPLMVPPYTPREVNVPLPAAAPPPAAPSEPAPQPPPTAGASAPAPTATPVRTFDHAGQSQEQLARRFDELKHQLKENRSQDTEMRGHVNRATMELHRLQLRLKKLQERHGDIQAELTALQTHLGGGTA